MNTLGLAIIVVGVGFLIESIMFKNKVNIYNRSDKFIIVNKHEFLRLQLYISIINSMCMSVFGIIVIIYNIQYSYVVAYPILFQLINYTIRPISRSKQYIEYK
ncbi:hypothetical protein K9O30_17460 [Clostridium bowmanii]|uniref:hypothetical protein n=1 Tax=Clostridium bowmanii TaxID=132925 RepID=UPI001C0DDA42|nr:hypothetical protein [Clostridium bowmanii]MBU3191091.1 hypothetical protein [Clostridium bowmanii]MCA1075477.1 hypothetical protein [Clostridium bowmanii]